VLQKEQPRQLLQMQATLQLMWTQRMLLVILQVLWQGPWMVWQWIWAQVR
jgi:hypothetical protein